ncbi:MAG: hypothetical protein JSW39_08495 [Desulfobacterales bacterium]|nr:MAG: hypothetical protein JSW39_08495 [Desulfobacterales bacterium]
MDDGCFRFGKDSRPRVYAGASGTAALLNCECQPKTICSADKCPLGITTQHPELRSRFDTEFEHV